MTQCARKDISKTVDLRPVLFITEWHLEDLEALKALSELKIPVLIDAHELQLCQDPQAILQVFAPDQVQIISDETEHETSAFSHCVETCGKKGWTHLIHVNRFSGPIISELKRSKELILANPWARIALVPRKRQTHRNNAFMQRLLDLGEKDYRNLNSEIVIYPIFYIQDKKFKKNDHYLHEKLLIHCLSGECEEVSLPVDYPEQTRTKNELLGWKKSFYDWWLIALTSLHNSTRPLHSSLSLAMGVFIACTPFYGLQTFLIITCAFIFRLSFPIAFLGSQVSLPPIYTLLVPLQLFVGFKITGHKFNFEGKWMEVAQNHFTSWLLGSLIVGGGLAILLGGFWYKVQMTEKKSKINWSGNMRGSKWAHWTMGRIIKFGGLPMAYFFLYMIVPYFYLFAPKARRGLSEYYRIIEPGIGWTRLQVRIIQHLYRFAQVLVDQVYQAMFKELKFDLTYREGEPLKKIVENSSQILIFSHFGGWGLTAQGFSRKGFDRTIYLVRYRSSKISTESVVKESPSENLKTLYFEPGEPIYMGIHDILSNSHDMALMGDRPFDNNFELLPFMGKLAPFPSTPFRLAKTYKVQLSFVLGFKEEGQNYGLAAKTLDMRTLSVYEAMMEYIHFVEKTIEQHPKQWFNHYNFFSRRPTRPDGSLCLPNRYSM